jgi:AcrR family transcriptional regulator
MKLFGMYQTNMNIPTRRYSMTRRAVAAAGTRERIRAAAAALHEERLWDEFTLAEVAARAGVSVQTVLRVFGRKEALAALAADAASRRSRRGIAAPGDTAGAIRILFDDYEAIGDRVIRYLADEMRHEAMRPMVEEGRRTHREWLDASFAAQLAAAAPASRAALRYALIAASDVYVWKLLRRDMRLDRAAAEAVVRGMAEAAIESSREQTNAQPRGRLWENISGPAGTAAAT